MWLFEIQTTLALNLLRVLILIKKIRHDFDFAQVRHEMVLSVVRDDLAVELEEVAESHEYENKPSVPATDTEDFYSHL